jgi:hypothetical protein
VHAGEHRVIFDVQRAGHPLNPPGHANPESLIADLIGIIFPAGQPAADRHGSRQDDHRAASSPLLIYICN